MRFGRSGAERNGVEARRLRCEEEAESEQVRRQAAQAALVAQAYKHDAQASEHEKHSLARRAWCEPQVLTAQSQTVRSISIDLILPVRGRARTEILARTCLWQGT